MTTTDDSGTDPRDPELLARLARLEERRQARSAGPVSTRSDRPTRQRHPALGTRIAATGLGGAALFGIITGLTYATSSPDSAGQDAPTAGEILVVPEPETASSSNSSDTRPIELHATPVVVRTVTDGTTPMATTSGSG